MDSDKFEDLLVRAPSALIPSSVARFAVWGCGLGDRWLGVALYMKSPSYSNRTR